MLFPAVTKRVLLQGLAATMLVQAAGAQSVLPPAGPMPTVRPMSRDGVAIDPARFGRSAPAAANPLVAPRQAAPAAATAEVDRSAQAFTASISAISSRPSDVRAIAGELAGGLKSLSAGDVNKARAIREGMRRGTLDRQILTWAIALNGGRDVPAREIATAAAELEGWPGMKTLRANSERALYREQPAARDVVQAFAGTRPQTAEGAMALARAQIELGQAGEARRVIARVWREDKMDRAVESQILKTFGPMLTKADHKRRMDMLLYADRVSDAERLKTLANAERLFAARAAVVREDKSAAKLLAAVPAGQRSDPGFLFSQVEYLRKADKVEEAARILLQAPTDRDALVDAEAWWNERRIIARDLLDRRRYKDAYRVAAAHSAENPAEAAEAEFHAGWIALSFLGDTKTAARHFSKIAELSNRPLSQSRAYYWLGRTADKSGSGNAAQYYGRSAAYSTTYYGQLSASRLGKGQGSVAYPKPSSAERQRFESRAAVQAIRRLEDLGLESRANILYRALADELTSPGELALLAAQAERRGDHYLALKVGKQANQRGIDSAAALAFPIGVIPASANISASGKALAYAIARQESEFNPGARSPAGALGLLQLMPGTAKSVAQKAGMPFSLARLTTDPGYNAALGSRFLGEQIDNFAGSYILTFAAYNAGPRRAREWVERFGDPRGKSIEEVVDWVERIPFTETRNYVQRVMENYQVYKMRLGAGSNIQQDLVFGRRAG
ncbi:MULTISPECIES: lytic transglycosylase domain-containing protein [unclassified Aureimonas]|uniref:lytic transglycosylase domain-containing protein n=2 Tax=unclassified Aureimonas TaxID=2615206 RepID=UPI001FCD4179|nr:MULTISPECIES: lytic transglycosylase domain-containing protein [unclassified Aureimonas]